MDIQWYPGHMSKTRRLIVENLSLVDIVIELLDARAPFSSKNPDLDLLSGNKKRIVVLNKVDLANESLSNDWFNFFSNMGINVVLLNSLNCKNISSVEKLARTLMKDKIDAQKRRGRVFVPIRAMVVGIPNVGKSTFINRFVGARCALAADRPGVTRGKQWIKINKDFHLLDMPGILWPKFEDNIVGLKLAFLGTIKEQITDSVSLALELISFLKDIDFYAIITRYNINPSIVDDDTFILQMIGRARGFFMKGGEVNLERTAQVLIDEFRSGKLGRITLEKPQDFLEG